MAKKKKNKKVIRYRRPLNINVGMIIFALIFAYMAFYVYTYVRREKIEFYEVPEGSIVNDQRHTGIAFRTETVKYTEQAGNINFYLREGKKAAVGTRVYSVDETGKLSELLAEKTDGSVALSRDNLASLKKQLSSFSQTFTENDFKTVYDTRYTLDSEVLEYVSVDALKNLDSVVEEMGVNFVQVRADQSGIVSYMVDSLEGVDPNQVTEEMFDRSGYTKNILKSGKLVGVGEPAYKLVTSSDWSLVFQMTEEDAALYNGKTALTVKFAGKDLKTPGAFSMITGGDGKTYGKLDFSKYMEQFISDRFVDFEIITEEVTGLKIPKSAV
ncbi:HlyD family efflux transporter periplasmic adaptor subunit, partial [Enterocloster sp.]